MGFKVLVLIALAFLAAGSAQNPVQDASENSPGERGRQIFVARCAKCHDEDMKKKLPDGSNLFARLKASSNPGQRLGTRLKDAQERDAVTSYFFELQRPSAGK